MAGTSSLAELLSDPATWCGREALARAVADELGVDPTVAEVVAGTLADNEQARREALARLADAHLSRRQASEIHDNVVQGLTATVYALELDDRPRVDHYLHQTLSAASELMSNLIEERAGDLDADQALVRSAPASLTVR